MQSSYKEFQIKLLGQSQGPLFKSTAFTSAIE